VDLLSIFNAQKDVAEKRIARVKKRIKDLKEKIEEQVVAETVAKVKKGKSKLK
jgi:hypothetical protein